MSIYICSVVTEVLELLEKPQQLGAQRPTKSGYRRKEAEKKIFLCPLSVAGSGLMNGM